MDFDDKSNVFKRRREGYELVRADEYPDFDFPTINDGKYAGVIGVGGLVLARITEELAKSREDYFRTMSEGKNEALENDVLKEQQAGVAINQERQTRVTFGGSGKD